MKLLPTASDQREEKRRLEARKDKVKAGRREALEANQAALTSTTSLVFASRLE